MKKQKELLLSEDIVILERHAGIYSTLFTKRRVKYITIIYLDKRLNIIKTYFTEFYYGDETEETIK